ncbi:MAG: hypothetical protein OHK0038_27150 [Flammeovirgaceae bacterium]
MIDTRANNTFALNLYAFTTTSTTGARESETIQFNTPLFTNTLSPVGEREGKGVFTPNLNLLALLKLLKKKENKSNERTTAAYTVRLKVDLYSITKTLISSSLQDFTRTSHSWQPIVPTISPISTNVAFVKFTVINPNTFPIFIDDWSIEEKGKVVIQENHYDPYGASLFGIEKTGNHEFLYQGKERNEELGLGWDDFEWRNYDITYFRTTTIDPKAEKFFDWSPYSWVACNPLKYIDPDGREFTEAAQKWVERYMREINSRIEKNNTKISEYQAELKQDGLTDKKIGNINKRIAKLEGENRTYSDIQGEVATLVASTQIYDVQTDNSLGNDQKSVGSAGFDFSNGNFVIKLPSSASLGLFAHELKHAHQFEVGEYSIGFELPNVAYKNLLYDKHDEVAAYARGALFGGGIAYSLNNLPAEYQNLPTGPYNITNINEINGVIGHPKAAQHLQRLANYSGHAFRVNGNTYYKKR